MQMKRCAETVHPTDCRSLRFAVHLVAAPYVLLFLAICGAPSRRTLRVAFPCGLRCAESSHPTDCRSLRFAVHPTLLGKRLEDTPDALTAAPYCLLLPMRYVLRSSFHFQDDSAQYTHSVLSASAAPHKRHRHLAR